MAAPRVNLSVIPTGGSVLLDLPDYLSPPSGVTNITIARAVSGVSGLSSFSTIYSGEPVLTWIDAGDLLPSPLLSGSAYVWDVSDVRGTTRVGPVYPASTVLPAIDGLTELIIRLLQGGVNNLTLPAGIDTVQVTTQMPQGGWQALPFIVVNLDLIQQTETQIGQDVQNPNPSNLWNIVVYAKRIWRITVLSRNAKERDYYRDSLIAMFQVLLATVFVPLGLEVHHTFQAASGTSSSEYEGKTPGFYYADLMLEVDGTYDVGVMTAFQRILSIQTTAVLLDGATQVATVPLSGSP